MWEGRCLLSNYILRVTRDGVYLIQLRDLFSSFSERLGEKWKASQIGRGEPEVLRTTDRIIVTFEIQTLLRV